MGERRTLRTCVLVERECNTRLVQSLADQIAALRRDMVVHLSKDHHKLALDVFGALQRIVGLAGAERGTVNIGREVANRRDNARIECAAVGEVPT